MKNEKKTQEKKVGDAKGKASFDENGKGAAPKYGAAGETPNESGDKTSAKNSEKAIDKSTD